MSKDVSLFSSLSGVHEEKIYVVDDYTLSVTGSGDVECQHGQISNVYHVPSLSANLLSVSQLTNTNNIVEFWSNIFIVKDLRLGGEIFTSWYLHHKYRLCKLCDSFRLTTSITTNATSGPTTLIT